MNKKAALQLSINAIVIIVLAMTLLGLGLGFIRGMFSDITKTTGTVQEQVKNQILDDLRTGDKRLSFPSNRITVSSGDKEDLAIGVKNTEDQELFFSIVIERRLEDGSFIEVTPGTNQDGSFFWDDSSQSLEVGEARVFGILHHQYIWIHL